MRWRPTTPCAEICLFLCEKFFLPPGRKSLGTFFRFDSPFSVVGQFVSVNGKSIAPFNRVQTLFLRGDL